MSRTKLPLPIMIYGIALAAIGVLGGIVLYANIGSAFPGVTLDGAPLQSAYMYVARIFAMGVMMVLALAFRDTRGILFVFVMRMLVELQDLLVTLFSGGSTMNPLLTIALYVGVFLIPEAFVIRWAWRTIQRDPTQPIDGSAARRAA